MLGDLIDHLPLNIDTATDIVSSAIGIKANRKTFPYDSLRICVIYPPFLKPQDADVFINMFCLNPISINQTLKKLSNKPNFVTNV